MPTYCGHCGGYHAAQCPRIKAIEYHPNGTIKRIEYHGAEIKPLHTAINPLANAAAAPMPFVKSGTN